MTKVTSVQEPESDKKTDKICSQKQIITQTATTKNYYYYGLWVELQNVTGPWGRKALLSGNIYSETKALSWNSSNITNIDGNL